MVTGQIVCLMSLKNHMFCGFSNTAKVSFFFVLSVLYFYTPWDKFDVISAFFWYPKHVTKDKIVSNHLL